PLLNTVPERKFTHFNHSLNSRLMLTYYSLLSLTFEHNFMFKELYSFIKQKKDTKIVYNNCV
ncbi:MAG: hypothetical protein JXA54_14470, partial [Candidatus Heimdallarchaeota archaeon]|nr:hypothetical protein [Candidatus Heimdallarchaeota archaeon]